MVILIYIFFTRTVYWHDVYWEHNLPNKTDAEYLEVWDLRFLHGNSDDEVVEKLGLDIVQSTFIYNGEIPREYVGLISSYAYKNINPREFLSNQTENIIDENYVIEDYDVMIHKNKAIFFWGYTYHASYNVDNEIAECGRGYEGYPNRLYFEYENNQWIVTSVFTTS